MFNELLKNVMNLGIITEDDVKRLTAIELMILIIERINGLLLHVNNVDGKLDTLSEDIYKITLEELNKWTQDGTFDSLINQTALKEVNDRLDETNTQLSDVANIQQSIFITIDNVNGTSDTDKFIKAVNLAKALNTTFKLTRDISLNLTEELDMCDFDGLNHEITLESQNGFLVSSNRNFKNCTVRLMNKDTRMNKSNGRISNTRIDNITCEYDGDGLARQGIVIDHEFNNVLNNLTFRNIVYCATINGVNKSKLRINNLIGYNTGQTLYITGRSSETVTWFNDIELKNIKLINTLEEKNYITNNFQQNGQGIAGFDVVLAENVSGMKIDGLHGEFVCERMLYCSNAMNVDVDNVVSYSSNGLKFCGYYYINKSNGQPTPTSVISKNFNANNIKLYGDNDDAILQIYDCVNVEMSNVTSNPNNGNESAGFLVRGGRKLENIVIRNADINKLKRCVFEYSKNFPYAEDSNYRYNESIYGLKFYNVNCRGIGLIKYSPRNCFDIMSDTVTSERIYRNIELYNCSFIANEYSFHSDHGSKGYGIRMLIEINNVEGLVIKNVKSRGHFLSYSDGTFTDTPLFPIKIGSNSRDIHIDYQIMYDTDINWDNVFDECYVSDESKFTAIIGNSGKTAHVEFIPKPSANHLYTSNINESYAYKGWLKGDDRSTFFFTVAKASPTTIGSVRVLTPDGVGYFTILNDVVTLEPHSSQSGFNANSWKGDGTTRIYCDSSNTKGINIRCTENKTHVIEFLVNVEK